jgi:light-regulated signal transduction histidine kinase (bacteriophytochrome)
VQLLLNLIGNALKYRGADPPRVHVSAERKGTEWQFAVQDNGIGIESRHHEQIFEIFKRLQGQREYPGSGIGLAVCRRVAHRHRGRIWVESEPGRGSVFYFTIFEGAEVIQ